jgi:hypothetical protein
MPPTKPANRAADTPEAEINNAITNGMRQAILARTTQPACEFREDSKSGILTLG